MHLRAGWRERAIAQTEFKCDRCGKCCTQPRIIDILVEDMHRLSRHFHKNFTFTAHTYATPHTNDNKRMMFKKSRPCTFYRDGCSIYSSRPVVCRMAPFLASPIPNHDIELISDRKYTDDEILEGLMLSSGLKKHEVIRWLLYIGAWEINHG